MKDEKASGPLDPNFSYVDLDETKLKALWNAYYPKGSGPLSMMRTVCMLIENIGRLRGFDVSKWVRQ